MHTTIDYSKMEEPAKSEKAIQDIIEYVGAVEYERLIKSIMGHKKKDILIGLSLFRGIEGFPAQVLADRYGAADDSTTE